MLMLANRIVRKTPTLLAVLFCASCTTDGDVSSLQTDSALQTDYHYQGEVHLSPESGRVAADWKITLREPDARSVSFLLNRNLADIAVAGAGVAGHAMREENFFGTDVWNIAVELDAPDASGAREILISYSGELLPEPMENGINTIAPDKVELTVDSFWSPIDSRFSRPATAEVSIAVDGEWVAVSPGEATKTEEGFTIRLLRPGLDIPFTLLRDPDIRQESGYALYDSRADGRNLEGAVEALAYCTGFLDSRYGAVDPLPQAKVVLHDRSEAGYSRKTLIALTDVSDTPRDRLTLFICHELAHYWSSRGRADTVENWLNEAFAEYAGLMAVRDAFGEETFNAFLQRYSQQVEDAGDVPPVWTPGATERGPYLAQYRKGPLALARLEEDIGEDLFSRIFQRYMTENITTTPELMDVVEEVAGEDARNAFTAYLAV